MRSLRRIVWGSLCVAVGTLWWSSRPSSPPVREWAELLAAHLDEAGRVDYARLATARPLLADPGTTVDFLSEDHELDERPGSRPPRPFPTFRGLLQAGSGSAR